jgi:hypothetical protein
MIKHQVHSNAFVCLPEYGLSDCVFSHLETSKYIYGCCYVGTSYFCTLLYHSCYFFLVSTIVGVHFMCFLLHMWQLSECKSLSPVQCEFLQNDVNWPDTTNKAIYHGQQLLVRKCGSLDVSQPYGPNTDHYGASFSIFTSLIRVIH